MSLRQIDFQDCIEYMEEGEKGLYNGLCFFLSFLVLGNFSTSKCLDLILKGFPNQIDSMIL